MEKLIVLIIVLLSVASTPLTLKKLIDRNRYGSTDKKDTQDGEDKNELL